MGFFFIYLFFCNLCFFIAISQMAEEEDTREVLFTDWQGADETGLTIEQTSGGEIFVKEVRGESPAARSGKVYEGRCFICFLIIFSIANFSFYCCIYLINR